MFATQNTLQAAYKPILKRISKSKKQIKIKVRVKKSLSEIMISGTDLKRLIYKNKDTKVFQGRNRIKINCRRNKAMRSPKNKRASLLASFSSKTGLISLVDEKYSGVLHLLTSPNSSECDLVNETTLDDYISSLLSKEMNSSWSIEALKAQAVAARSYALHKIQSKEVSKLKGFEAYYDLENSEKHQVSGHFFDATKSTIKASKQTKGEVLVTKSGELTPIFFHAKCGGKTLLPRQVWDNPVSNYSSVKCPFCRDHGKKGWKSTISYKRMIKFLDWSIGKKAYDKAKIVLAPDRINNTKMRFYLGDRVYVLEKSLLRRYFGRNVVLSNRFTLMLKKKKLALEVKGKGLGHGVGMCQLGALDMSDRGMSYKQILAHYFPGHKVKKVY
ncbi:MAG: SpoIID/LytB domain-containing protein [Bacteriovoracaceae bacterium]|nr:SpoIID/LytB domain-containing protein [Bacteriovoracaceae bacterium]